MPSNASRSLALAAGVAMIVGGADGALARREAPPRAPLKGQSPNYPPRIELPADLPPDAPAAPGPRGTSDRSDDPARYDAVGYASWYGAEMGGGRTASGQSFNARAMSAAHPSLPMGSFVEVTSLDSGRTILAVVTDRGPSGGGRIIDLSRAAAELLGIDRAGIAPVRVRRVDPPGPDQTALREGRSASPRIDTPPILLTALRKRLPPRGRAAPPVVARAPISPPRVQPEPGPPTANADSETGWFVQVLATASRDKADALARALGASVMPAGRVFRVRLGPFVDAETAARARDGVAGRGYGDARVLHE